MKRGSVNFNKYIYILLFLIAVLPVGSMAFELNAVTLTDSMGKSISRISTNNPLLVNLEFSYTLGPQDSFEEIKVDAAKLYPDGIYSGADYSHLTPICTENEGSSFSCEIKGLILKSKISTIPISVTGKYSNPQEVVYIKNETQMVLTVDDSKPKVKFMGTQYCSGTTCYIASGQRNKIIISMQDEYATFEKGFIGFRTAGKDEMVDVCEGMTCNGSTKITCTDNQRIPLSLRHGREISRDDTGNKVEGAPVELICDETAPEVTGYSFSSAVGDGTLVIGKDILLSFNVTDSASPKLSLLIDAGNIAAANASVNCTKADIEGSTFNCRAVLRPAIEMAGEYTISAVFTDIVGRQAKYAYTLKLLQTSNQSINLWKVSSVEQSSSSFSRPNLEFERILFAKVNFQSSMDAEIIDMKPEGRCYAKDNTTGIDSDIVSVRLVSKQSKALYVKVALRANDDGRYDSISSLEYLCPVIISSKKGNYFFGSPEQDNFTIKIDLKDDMSITQIHEREIEKYTKSVEENFARVDKLTRVVNYAQGICSVCAGISSVNTLTGSLQTGLGAFPATYPAAQAMGQVNNGLQGITYSGICETAQGFCEYVTCSHENQQIATGWLSDKMGGNSKIYNYAGYDDFQSTLNPYKSYLVAISTMCIPAVAYHYNNYVGIQCNYLDCISNDYVKYGQDISTCQQDKAISECMYWSGGALDAIPMVSMVRDVSSRVGNMMKDPAQLFGFALPFACIPMDALPAGHIAKGICVSTQEVFTSAREISRINEMIEQISKVVGNKGASSSCGSILATVKSSEYRFRQLNEIGYAKTDYEPVDAPNGQKGMQCTSSECKLGKGANMITMKIVRDENGKATNEVLYYLGNQKITPSNMYTENIKNVDLDTASIGDANSQKLYRQRWLDSNMRALDSARMDPRVQMTEYQYNEKVAYYTSLANSNQFFEKFADVTLKQLDAMYATKAIESADRAKAKFEAEFSQAAEQLNAVYKAENKWKKIMLLNVKYAEETKKVEDLNRINVLLEQKENREDGLLSKEKENQLAELIDKYYPAPKPEPVLESEELKNLKSVEFAVNIELNRLPSNHPDIPALKEQLANTESQIKTLQEQSAAAAKAAQEAAESQQPGTKTDKGRIYTKEEIKELKDKTDNDQKEITGNKDYLDTKEQRQAQRAALKEIREAKIEVDYEKYFGNARLASMSAWGNAQAVAGMRAFLNMNWGLANPNGKMAQAGDFLIEEVSEFERGWCTNKVKPSERLGDAVILNSVGGDIFSTGAQVGGRKSQPVTDGTKTYYEYWVQGNVVSNKNDGLNLRVVFYDSDGKEYPAKFAGEEIVLAKGGQYTFGRPKATYFTDAVNYDRICILFGNPLTAYFDHVSGNSGNQICQKIISE